MENIFKQIIFNITDNEGKANIIINTTFLDETKFVKVIASDKLTEKDQEFIDELKALVLKYNQA